MFLNLNKMYLQNYLKAGLTRPICARRAIHFNTVVDGYQMLSSDPTLRQDLSLILLGRCPFPTKTNEIHGA